MTVADTYRKLKAEETALKAKLKAASEAVNAELDAGNRVIASDGTEYIRETAELRTYKVTGLGGILALLRNHTELDAATLLSVTNAAVKKLPEELQSKLSFTVKPSHKVVVKR